MKAAAFHGLALIVSAAVLWGAASPEPSPSPGAPKVLSFDVFSTVLSPERRAQLSRDSRCSDAKRATDVFADLRDARDGVTAVVALEKCAILPRVGNWSDFVDYTLTAAGAAAYAVGVAASEPKAFERALRDLSHVAGFQAPSTQTVVLLTNNPVMAQPGPTSAAQASMEAGLPMQNSVTRSHTTTHVTGYSGPYGELATEVGNAAQAALEALQRSARPQEKAPK